MTRPIVLDTPDKLAEYRKRTFWSRVPDLPPDVCWDWQGNTLPNGYGTFSYQGKNRYAHRTAYEWLVGPIPDGYQVDHLCRNRRCVNPFHLEPVTPWLNTMRSESFSARFAQRVTCSAGHPYTIENTAIHPKNAARICRTCHRDVERRRKAALKGAAA